MSKKWQKNHQEKNRTTLEPRRLPVQQRAKQRTQQILDTTAQLLEEVGIDQLSTILIAKKMGISVGSLYHYFPNKTAILYSLGAGWLAAMTKALEDIERLNFSTLSLEQFIDHAIDSMLDVYTRQRATLPLAQALWSIPALRDLDLKHDKLIIAKLVGIYERLGFPADKKELDRVGRVYLELTHALLLTIVDQKPELAQRTLIDLKRMVLILLDPKLISTFAPPGFYA